MESTLDGRVVQELDPIEEIRMRTWARRNYTPADERSHEWHPVILDEMRRKDNESRTRSAK